ncbi:MAG: T9SS type A sorting domain-containing protein [Flavobacteriales bacterium]|nr:T9SS type A sorting domain-containing protein [Flavobacteriales bacterium]
MKKVIIAILLSQSSIMFGQDDLIPISQNGVWTMQSGSWILDEFVLNPPFGIGIESLVNLNDTTYFQFSAFDFCSGSNEYSPYFLIREDSGKYFHRMDALHSEQLWFDFTLEVGDTIYLQHCYQDILWEIIAPEQLTVLSIEPTSLDNGSIRQKWTLQYSDNLSGMYLMTEEWIEGIGSTHLGWYKPLAQTCVDSGYNMRCYYENEEWVDAFGAFGGTVSDTNCCDIVGIHEITLSNFNLFPNPTPNELNVQSSTTISLIEIFNPTGRVVYSVQPNSPQTKLTLESFPSGLYFMTVTTENGNVATRKFIKD